MQYGVLLPQNEGMRDPISARDFAQAAEDLGYNYLVAFDHVVGAEPTNRPEGWRTGFNHKTFVHEPLILFAYLGAVTKTLGFSTEIIILPQRQTVMFAKHAAECDYLTGGRLRLGIGIGWNAIEFESLNEPFGNRGRRVEEQFHVLRALWSEEVVDFKGRYHTLDRVGINPMPVQRPIPLWMGGYADTVLDRTARIADGWMPLFGAREERANELLPKLRAALKKHGRDEKTFGLDGRMNIVGAPGTIGPVADTPDEWRKDLDAWNEIGASHLDIGTGASPNLNDHIELMRRFKQEAGF